MLTTQENTINGMTAQAYTAVSRLSVNVYQVQAALANKGAGQELGSYGLDTRGYRIECREQEFPTLAGALALKSAEGQSDRRRSWAGRWSDPTAGTDRS